MRIIKLLCTLIVLVIFAGSCKDVTRLSTLNINAIKVGEFVKTSKIQFTTICDYTDGKPRDVKMLNDSMLVVLNYGRKDNPWFSIVNVKRADIDHQIGSYGRGPNEALFISSFGFYKNGAIWGYDATTSTIVNCEMGGQSDFTKSKKIQFKGYKVDFIDDTLLVGSGHADSEFKFNVYSTNSGERVLGISEFVCDNSEDIHCKEVQNFFTSGELAVKPDGSMFVACYDYLSEMEIYSNRGEKIVAVRMGDEEELEYEFMNNHVVLNEKTKIGFPKVCVTDDYVFVAHSGKAVSSDYDKGYLCQEIFVFDWNGRSIAKYYFDNFIRTFAVSLDNSVIYSYSELTGDVITAKIEL